MALILTGAVAGGLAWSLGFLSANVDESVAAMREEYACPSCGRTFSLSIADATTQRRTDAGIRCPHCGKGGAEKDSAFSAELQVPAVGQAPAVETVEDEARQPDSSKAVLVGPNMVPEKRP